MSARSKAATASTAPDCTFIVLSFSGAIRSLASIILPRAFWVTRFFARCEALRPPHWNFVSLWGLGLPPSCPGVSSLARRCHRIPNCSSGDGHCGGRVAGVPRLKPVSFGDADLPSQLPAAVEADDSWKPGRHESTRALIQKPTRLRICLARSASAWTALPLQAISSRTGFQGFF